MKTGCPDTVQYERGTGVQDAVHEQLDPVAPKVSAVPGAAHVVCFFQIRQLLVVLVMKRHFYAAVEAACLMNFMEQFALIQIAIHIVHRGNAERGAVLDTLPEGGNVCCAL